MVTNTILEDDCKEVKKCILKTNIKNKVNMQDAFSDKTGNIGHNRHT